jgi:hypothetical protein
METRDEMLMPPFSASVSVSVSVFPRRRGFPTAPGP